jgi:transposase
MPSENIMNIEQLEVKRLDHLGIIAGVIKDLNIIEMIDERLGIYDDEKITAGEAVAGMIINGLGFSNKPMYLTPLFFKNRPVEELFRKGVKAEDFNHFKLGRVLDRSHGYGTEALFSEISLNVCRQEQVDTRFNSEDTTSFTLSGDYLTRTDEDTVKITLGYSKDHRPDLKQVMLEMMVSQDGGIPLIGKALDGNASDNTVFEERSKALVSQFKDSETLRYTVADSKIYTKKNSSNLKDLLFITRIPDNIKEVGETIDKALALPNNWQKLDDGRVMQTFCLEHYEMEQRWHVISSETSKERASKQIDKQVEKEAKRIKKEFLHLQARRFTQVSDAQDAIKKLGELWKFHLIKCGEIIEHKKYKGKGRPKKGQKPESIEYQVIVTHDLNENKINQLKEKKAHYIIGGNTAPNELSDHEVIHAYKEQHHVERGFRFLKDPLFFTSSLFIKTPQRIMGLLMVMLLSLLVYGIAERRMRMALKEQEETLPNQINKETQTPTLRWIFQLLEGINCLKINVGKNIQNIIEGITQLQQKVLQLFGKTVTDIYQIYSGCPRSM